ncbi:MAG: bile acid:sodium symporter [Rhizobiales bacterium]|nr:bile acid:sodium symporter [Hyphomicrobiales bacterium]
MKIRGFSVDGFMLALVAVVILAALVPQLGATGGPLHVDQVATYGIALIFFLYGLTLAPDKLKQGASHWRLHIVVQAATFVVFPAIVFLLVFPFRDSLPPGLATGFLYLGALPSTVSSSVALTGIARGNVPIAIFNATLSSIIGVFATPLLMAWFASTTGDPLPILPVITKIILLVLLPMVLGQIARIWLKNLATKHVKKIRMVDRIVILLIVFNAFSDSMIGGVWEGHDVWLIGGMLLGAILIFVVVYLALKLVCRLLSFDVPDTIACLFCGTVKSLATGVPLARIMFGNDPLLGLIIAPTMIYHVFQLFVLGIIANRYAARPET